MVDEELNKQLLEKGRKASTSHHKNLAGHFKDEKLFSDEDRQWFVDNYSDYFIPYWQLLQTRTNPTYYYGMDPFKKIWLSNLWINFMKQGDFNPPHRHDGDFSFVLYLQVPKEIQEENKIFEGRGTGPGTISFLYGEDKKGIKTSHGIDPYENHMYIFQAGLTHCVPPFKSDVERISVSGNWFIIDNVKENDALKIGQITIK